MGAGVVVEEPVEVAAEVAVELELEDAVAACSVSTGVEVGGGVVVDEDELESSMEVGEGVVLELGLEVVGEAVLVDEEEEFEDDSSSGAGVRVELVEEDDEEVLGC